MKPIERPFRSKKVILMIVVALSLSTFGQKGCRVGAGGGSGNPGFKEGQEAANEADDTRSETDNTSDSTDTTEDTNDSDGNANTCGEDGSGRIIIKINASRTYSPSSWSNQTISVSAGVYTLPSTLSVGSGNAGTGWASITTGQTRYCYQGISGNNTQKSRSFRLRGKTSSDRECHAGPLSDTDDSLTVNDTSFVVSVHGGGCGSQCENTELQTDLEGTLQCGLSPAPETPFAKLNGAAFIVLPVGEDRLLIGGDFTKINGDSCPGAAIIHKDGSVDADFCSNMAKNSPNGSILSAVRLSTGHFYVVGDFTEFAGNKAGGIARITADGTVDELFMKLAGLGFNGTVHSVTLLTPEVVTKANESLVDAVLLTGAFTAFNGEGTERLARLLPMGKLDPSFGSEDDDPSPEPSPSPSASASPSPSPSASASPSPSPSASPSPGPSEDPDDDDDDSGHGDVDGDGDVDWWDAWLNWWKNRR